MTDPSLEDIIDEAFTADLASLPTAEVRRRKAVADAHEAALSYARRILQGKIDLLKAELASRQAADSVAASASPSDIAQALEPRRDRGFRGRFPAFLSPPETEEVRSAELLVADPIFARLEEVSDEEIAEVTERLESEERRISSLRGKLHERIDTIEAELVRRYSSGEASVDEVLAPYVEGGN